MPKKTVRPAPTPIVIAVVGSKGGTLKTATVAALMQTYAERGYSVVGFDLDGQGTLTRRHGFDRVKLPLAETAASVRYVLPTKEELFVAGSVSLYRSSRTLEAARAWEIAAHIRRATTNAREEAPHFVVLDTPPALGPITQEAMRAASIVVVPSETSRDGLDGIGDILTLHCQMQLAVPIRVLLTKTLYLNRDIAAQVRTTIDDEVPFAGTKNLRLKTEIPFRKAGLESSSFYLPVTLTAPADRVSVNYRALATEICDVLGFAIRRKRAVAPVEAA